MTARDAQMRRGKKRKYALECLVLVDDLYPILVVLRGRLAADRGEMAVHGCVDWERNWLGASMSYGR